MKKVFKKIRSIKLPSSLLIFLAIFVVSIFGLQVSKMYAQSYLSSSLNVVGSADISGPLTVNGGMGVGSGAPGSGLIVHGGGNFSGMVYGTTPMENQPGYLATVSYVQSKVASIPACPACPTCPTCPTCPPSGGGTNPPVNQRCFMEQDYGAPCDGPMPSRRLGSVGCPPNTYFRAYLANSCPHTTSGTFWNYECCPTGLDPIPIY